MEGVSEEVVDMEEEEYSAACFAASRAQKWRIRRDQRAACPLSLTAHAPTPSFAPIKFSSTSTASSPFVTPLIISPFTFGRRSRLLLCVLSGSLKLPDGYDRNGGGKGRDGRLAYRA